ncbi:MAG: hypothetical protein F9K32_06360 [Desulfobulbaceae bacterium]|nr:MAG: hypothetical protein F9K32_06360 [Desulfobulbaceae bacterium]
MNLTHAFDYLQFFFYIVAAKYCSSQKALLCKGEGDERIIIRSLRFESDLAREAIHGNEATIQ